MSDDHPLVPEVVGVGESTPDVAYATEYRMGDPPNAPWMIRIGRERGLSYDEARAAMRATYDAVKDLVLPYTASNVALVLNRLDDEIDRILERRRGEQP